eukprot:10215864-Alexandrium_andersonii.AAC.1
MLQACTTGLLLPRMMQGRFQETMRSWRGAPGAARRCARRPEGFGAAPRGTATKGGHRASALDVPRDWGSS